MRDPNRIEPIMRAVEELWENNYPDMRFCQFMAYLIEEIYHALGDVDPFYLEDDRVMGILEEIKLKNLWADSHREETNK